VLLNGGGFEAPDWSLRVSLANLSDEAYEDIGRGVDRSRAVTGMPSRLRSVSRNGTSGRAIACRGAPDPKSRRWSLRSRWNMHASAGALGSPTNSRTHLRGPPEERPPRRNVKWNGWRNSLRSIPKWESIWQWA